MLARRRLAGDDTGDDAVDFFLGDAAGDDFFVDGVAGEDFFVDDVAGVAVFSSPMSCLPRLMMPIIGTTSQIPAHK